MGNVIGQIQWRNAENNKEWRRHLIQLAIERGLTRPDANDLYPMDGYHKAVGVEIAGYHLAWVGQAQARTRIQSYLYEARVYLESKCKVRTEDITTMCILLPI